MQAEPKTILAAVDFGDASARAVALAGALAGRCGAKLKVLHAESLDVPPYFTRAQLQVLEGEAHASQARAADYLRDFARQQVTGPFEVVIAGRTATDAILHASTDVDLVVMGTHGRRGPSRWWLGSVAERVLRDTRVPVMVAHAGDTRPADAAFSAGLLVVDRSSPVDQSRALARSIAACVNGTIVEAEADDVPRAREALGATWLAVPVPTPRGDWLSRVGEPLVQGCTMPVLFVPEAKGGPSV